jgi:pyridoxal phosphate enzyme (YggS family)
VSRAPPKAFGGAAGTRTLPWSAHRRTRRSCLWARERSRFRQEIGGGSRNAVDGAAGAGAESPEEVSDGGLHVFGPRRDVVIAERVQAVRAQIAAACQETGRHPDAVKLMAVTKGHPATVIPALYAAGIRLFGENRVQEAVQKYPEWAARFPDISLHLIGHLQTNKVKLALSSFQVIQTLDTPTLAEAINRRAGDRTVPVMVEVNMGREPQKFGVSPDAVRPFIEQLGAYPRLRVIGLMAMLPAWPLDAPLEGLMDEAFRLWQEARRDGWPWAPLDDLSMGMSHDYVLAVRHGSTLVRLGTALLGDRPQ